MGKLERLERKSEKKIESGKIYGTDLLENYENERVIPKKELIKKAWNKEYPSRNFDVNLAAYLKLKARSALNTPSTIAEGPKEENVVPTTERLEQLKLEIESFKDQKNITYAITKLIAAGLKPANLLDPKERDKTIRVIFDKDVNIANILVSMLHDSDAGTRKEGETIVAKIKTYLEKSWNTVEETVKTTQEFSETMALDGAKKKFENILSYAHEKPVAVLLYSIATIGLLTAAYKYTEFGKKYLPIAGKGLLLASAGGLSLYGLNQFVGAYRDDGRTAIDLINFSQKTYDYKNLTSFKERFGNLTHKDKNAFDAIMEVGKAKASNVLSSFNAARGTGKIDIKSFFANNTGVDLEKRKSLSPGGLYKGIEGIFRMIAEEKLGINPEGADAVEKGKMYFRENYASNGKDFEMVAVIADLANDHGKDLEKNADGFVDPDVIENRAAVEALFTKAKIEASVQAQKTGVVLVDGYPYAYSYNIDKKTHVFKDTISKKEFTALHEIKGNSETEIKKLFKAYNVEPKFDAVEKKWFFETSLDGTAWLKLEGSQNMKVYGEVEDSNLVLKLSGSEIKYKSLDEIKEGAKNHKIAEKVKKDLGYLLSEFPLTVKSTNEAANSVTIKIDESEGTLIYKNGVLDLKASNIPENRIVKDARKEKASLKYDEGFEKIMANGKSAEHIFDDLGLVMDDKFSSIGLMGHVKDLFNIASERWNDKSPLMYNRKEVWKESVEQKKSEIKLVYSTAISKILASGVKGAKSETQINSEIANEFRELTLELQSLDARTQNLKTQFSEGKDFDQFIKTEIDNLENFGYKSQKYKNFMKDIELIMQRPEFDYIGPDGMAYARKIRNHIRERIFEYSLPLSALNDSQFGSKETLYLDKIRTELPVVLKLANINADGNQNIVITEDQRIDEEAFEKVFTEKFKPFE